MHDNPLVSVIMPCYNAEGFISESIESVFAQSYNNWELVITDDCSSDRTPEIVRAYCEKDSRINFAIAEQHSGIAGTRNHCLKRAKGRFVAFLDNDDIYYPHKIEKQVNFMLENGYAFSYASYELMNENGSMKGKVIKTNGIIDYDKYLRNTIIGSGTIMLDREKTGMLRMPNNATSDDMALWCKILKDGHCAYPINDILLKYRIRSHSASSNKLKAARDVWLVYRKQEKLPLSKALIYFLSYAFHAVKKRLV